jgi:hypothetical protein
MCIGLEIELSSQQIKSTKQRKSEFKGYSEVIEEQKSRKWYCNRGKAHVLHFTNDEIYKLKECFNALDDDGSGCIGIEELEDPLIGLGFAANRE